MAKRLLAIPLAVGVVTLFALWFAGRAANPDSLGFRLDDAWIHLVYARGLLQNGYFAYNDGIASTGCTAPLWAALLALLQGVFVSHPPEALIRAILLTGAAIHLIGVGAAASLAHRLSGSDSAGVAAGCLVALATPLAAASFSGMGVSLTATLLLLGVQGLCVGAWTRGGVFLALAGLARPESALVILALSIAVGIDRIRTGKSFLPVIVRILAPSLIAGSALIAYNLWASGLPLPSTFYAKRSGGLGVLPLRFQKALLEIIPQVPPFALGIGWLGLLGFIPWRRRIPSGFAACYPLCGGLVFLAANLFVLDPVDPLAFYHLRYLLPALPMLLVALAIGAFGMGSWFHGPAKLVPTVLLLFLSIFGAARTVIPVSLHLHNDVRNINEVQRRMGEWLGAALPPGTWIAASDAGAVRYFSKLPTIDVIGLNTLEMLEHDEDFVRTHPVVAIALMPAWFRTPHHHRMERVFSARTENYTVTSNPDMATQFILRVKTDQRERVLFSGFHPFQLDLVPSPALSELRTTRQE